MAQFRRYFASFGDIEDIVILKDTKTLRPRGFGFVTYTDIRSVNTVLKLRDEHQIEGKWIDVKSAVPADQMQDLLISQQIRNQNKSKASSEKDAPTTKKATKTQNAVTETKENSLESQLPVKQAPIPQVEQTVNPPSKLTFPTRLPPPVPPPSFNLTPRLSFVHMQASPDSGIFSQQAHRI